MKVSTDGKTISFHSHIKLRRYPERRHLGFLSKQSHSLYRKVHTWFCFLQVGVILAILAMVAAAAQEAKKENLRGSESIHFGSPFGAYGTYGAYPYVSLAGYPAAAPAYPALATGYPTAAFSFYG